MRFPKEIHRRQIEIKIELKINLKKDHKHLFIYVVMWRYLKMRITSQNKVKEYLDKGFKLEKLEQHKRTLYYLTNHKDCEITVPKKTIDKMVENDIIDWQLDYRPNAT